MTVSRRARIQQNSPEGQGDSAGGMGPGHEAGEEGAGNPTSGERTKYVRVSMSALYEETPEHQESVSVYEGSESTNKIIKLQQCDITELIVDAIACSVQDNLMKPPHGLCKHVWGRGGNKLKEQCKAIGHCSPGTSFVTPGFNLPAKYVLHTAIPPPWSLLDYNARKAELKQCYLSCLQHVRNMPEIQSVALPCLGSGAAEIELLDAIKVAVAALREWLNDIDNKSSVQTIVLCMFDQTQWDTYIPELVKAFPYGKVCSPERSCDQTNSTTTNVRDHVTSYPSHPGQHHQPSSSSCYWAVHTFCVQDYAGLDLETLNPVDIDTLKLPEYVIASNILCYKYKLEASHTITRHFHKMANTCLEQLPVCDKPPQRHKECVTFHLGGQGHHQVTLYHSNITGTIEIRVTDFSGDKDLFSREMCKKVKNAVKSYLNTHLESITSFSVHIRCERTTWGESEKLWPMESLLELQRNGKEHPCYHGENQIGETHLCNPSSMLAFWSDGPCVQVVKQANGLTSPQAENLALRASGPIQHDDGIHELLDPISTDSADIEPGEGASKEKSDNYFGETGQKKLKGITPLDLGHIQKLTKAAYPRTSKDKSGVKRSNNVHSPENTCEESLDTNSAYCEARENEESMPALKCEMSGMTLSSYQEMSYMTFDDNINRNEVKTEASAGNKSAQVEQFLDHSTDLNLTSLENPPGFCDRRQIQQMCTRQSDDCVGNSNSGNVRNRKDSEMCETINVSANCGLLSASTNCNLTVSQKDELQCQNTHRPHPHSASGTCTYHRPTLRPDSGTCTDAHSHIASNPTAQTDRTANQNDLCAAQQYDQHTNFRSGQENSCSNAFDSINACDIRECSQNSCTCNTCLHSVTNQNAHNKTTSYQNAHGISANQKVQSDIFANQNAHSDIPACQSACSGIAASQNVNNGKTVHQICTKASNLNRSEANNLNIVQAANVTGTDVANGNGVVLTNEVYGRSSHQQRPKYLDGNHNSYSCPCQSCNETVSPEFMPKPSPIRGNQHFPYPPYVNHPMQTSRSGCMLVPPPHTFAEPYAPPVFTPAYQGNYVPTSPNPQLAWIPPNPVNDMRNCIPISPNPGLAWTSQNAVNGLGNYTPVFPNPEHAWGQQNVVNIHGGMNYGNSTGGVNQGHNGQRVGYNHVAPVVSPHHAMLSDRNLFAIARCIGANQLQLGIELGHSQSRVEQIIAQTPRNIIEQGYYIMKEWIQMDPRQATPQTLLGHMSKCSIDMSPIQQILGVA